jgi:DNA polymerase
MVTGAPDTELASNALRACIMAQPGCEFSVADWSNIEGRALAWLADDTVELEYFRAQDRGEAPDSYKYQWSRFFGMAVEEVTKRERQASKQVKLACQYLGSTGALVTMALGNNINLDELMEGLLEKFDERLQTRAHRAWKKAFIAGDDFGLKPYTYKACAALVARFREINNAVTEQGYGLGRVVRDALRKPNTMFRALKCDIWFNYHALIIQLPSGRRLFYWSPEVYTEQEDDPVTGLPDTPVEGVRFRAARGKQWRWVKGWPGIFVENVTQAVANDVLRAGMLNVQRHCQQDPKLSAWLNSLPEHARTPIVLTVHDEVVTETPIGFLPHEKLEWLLTDDLAAKHPWMKGLPLAASGWTGVRYRK